MKPTIEQLHNSPRYEFIESFHIDEMGHFLMRELGLKQPTTNTTKPKLDAKSILFFLFLAGIGGVVGWGIGRFIPKSGDSSTAFDALDTQFGLAFIGFFVVLIPIHEVIHAVAFKALGAQKVGFGWSTKSMIVYAYAQKFAMTLRENSWVAVMPFIVITISLTILWYLFPQWQVFWGLSLFLHTSACIGDFILIKYYFKNKHHNLYTYDDIEGEKRSYFFKEVPR
jgi:hypothetical protein